MATTVKVYNASGEVVGEQKLVQKLFAVKVKPTVVHQVVVAQEANSRQTIAHTKTKGEVRGGGRKPWKQKGTGRARTGSIRNPQWRGGGVVFGPRSNRNFTQKVNKKMKNVALAMVLSDKLANDKLVIVDQFDVKAGKTKQLRDMLSKLPSAGQRVLMSLGTANSNVVRAASNLATTGCCAANSLNVVDIIKYDYLILDQSAVATIENTFGK